MVIRKVWSLTLIISAVCLITAVSFAMSPLRIGGESIGQKAAGFSLPDTKGDQIDVSVFIGKKPVVFFFWTTWCPHCRRQIEQLEKEARSIKKSGAELILVDVNESSYQVKRFLKGIGSSLESLLDVDSEVTEMYKVIGVPTFVIVGKDGIIKFSDNLLPNDYQKFITNQ